MCVNYWGRSQWCTTYDQLDMEWKPKNKFGYWNITYAVCDWCYFREASR